MFQILEETSTPHRSIINCSNITHISLNLSFIISFLIQNWRNFIINPHPLHCPKINLFSPWTNQFCHLKYNLLNYPLNVLCSWINLLYPEVIILIYPWINLLCPKVIILICPLINLQSKLYYRPPKGMSKSGLLIDTGILKSHTSPISAQKRGVGEFHWINNVKSTYKLAVTER